ncbi:hypothetical protein TrLO_g9211 [Triparma laevis f. longispina]|uniref:RING-type domain-containing protein n=1 Tax=Triparma laevis f. longispina TaxID=1714387 RepID=A0A9W7KVM2_9STRA|nr:hypothetical protein TrLO_g9211 [Triparma laevis f. longispina]
MPAEHGRRTLAQLRGLAPLPPKKLTEEEWVGVETSALIRGDVTGHCSICMENLGTSDQILLSCSHTFHKKCIEAFERFNIYEISLCPVCRDDYTKINVFNVKQMALGDGRFFVD